MREKILTFIEKNSRIDLKELAIVLGVDETTVMNELEKMEEEHIICGYHTLIDWDKAGISSTTDRQRQLSTRLASSNNRFFST